MLNRMATVVAVLVFLAPKWGAAESEPVFEQPHEIPIQSVLPEGEQSGLGFMLGESVYANGFSQDYVVKTEEFGEFSPTSDYMLAVRLHEIHALQELGEIRKSDEKLCSLGALLLRHSQNLRRMSWQECHHPNKQ